MVVNPPRETTIDICKRQLHIAIPLKPKYPSKWIELSRNTRQKRLTLLILRSLGETIEPFTRRLTELIECVLDTLKSDSPLIYGLRHLGKVSLLRGRTAL